MVLYIYIYVWTHLFSIQILLEDPQTEFLAVTVMQAKNLNGSEGAMKPPGGGWHLWMPKFSPPHFP